MQLRFRPANVGMCFRDHHGSPPMRVRRKNANVLFSTFAARIQEQEDERGMSPDERAQEQ
jgi:hypothetical protein